MKFKSISKVLLLAPLSLFALQPHAQTGAAKTGFVNVQMVVAVMPGGSGFVTLSQKVDTDLKARATALQALQSKAAGRTATAADRDAFNKAAQKYQADGTAYQKQLQQAFAPLASRVNAAVAVVARASGYSLVLDKRVARDRGLVVYANAQATDLTAAVTARVKAGN
jgi:outer membrane protein